MENTISRTSNTISISNFYEDYLLEKYNMTPPYQRRSVWSIEKKSFFIDSILKNLPIPPIFLKRNIDDISGKTSYAVIDGKQRLTAIIEYIHGEFSATSENDDVFYDERLDGKFFFDLDDSELVDYKKIFWRYLIPIEYIDTDSPQIIDNIFDRLNRNGEVLNGQELRHANYYNTSLLKTIGELAAQDFWIKRLEYTDKSRMEDNSFISELVFSILEDGVFTSTDEILNDLYKKYAEEDVDWNSVSMEFKKISSFMNNLSLDYDGTKIYGVSHLYGIWVFCRYCVKNNIDVSNVKNNVLKFFEEYKRVYRSKDIDNKYILDYKMSMQSRTKFKGQREKRISAIKGYCNLY